ncbi:dTDP-4-dehydrorhamnose 3,5-epimerase [Falsiroseomonas sp. E2-1-a4]|uniref:dTDP-4-dehydrorhamnose 3,5-epimerase n=1 Tax=Falsiroseomonas sp. E2-1-a4 TaxID=3239299 RepID=UPI003F3EAAE8
MPDGAGPHTAEIRRSGNVEARSLGLEGPLLLSVRRFADSRGAFIETYSRRDFAAIGIPDEFVQDNQSLSVAVGTVRGLHFQLRPRAQGKLVRVLRGQVLDVAVDLRAASPSFGRHVTVDLSAENRLMLWVPPGFAHGFVTRAPETEIAYKVTALYAPDCDRSLAWNDPALGIDWGVAAADATLSDKDHRAPLLADLGPAF